MRILVTGGAGFIGSNLVRLLIARGHDVLVWDKLTYAGNRASLSDLEPNPRLEWLVGDICDASLAPRAFGAFKPDWVMHLAAESHVDRSIDGPGDFIRTNILGTFHLLQAALGHWRALEGAARAAPSPPPLHPLPPPDSTQAIPATIRLVQGDNRLHVPVHPTHGDQAEIEISFVDRLPALDEVTVRRLPSR